MEKIQWLETFDLWVPEIDGDHRAMLDLMKAVESAAKAGDRERYMNCADRLLEFSHEHFIREQRILKRSAYPDLAAHTRYHDDLYARAEAVKEACSSIDSPQEFRECWEEMLSFLIDDIVRGDHALKSFLQEAGLTIAA